MKITKVSYNKTFATGPYLNEKIGIEIEVDSGEEAEEAFRVAVVTVGMWHKSANPHLYQESKTEEPTYTVAGRPPIVYQPPPPVIEYEKEPPTDYLSLIQSAPTFLTLKQFKVIAGSPGNEELYKAYNDRVKILIKQENK